MNLHQIASGDIRAVNPMSSGTVMISTGNTMNADGTRTPTYQTFRGVEMQVQPVQFRDLAQLDGLNLNGTRRSIYLNGRADGVVRSLVKGGDLIVLTDGPNAGTWLVALVAEQFPDWCRVLATLQVDQ